MNLARRKLFSFFVRQLDNALGIPVAIDLANFAAQMFVAYSKGAVRVPLANSLPHFQGLSPHAVRNRGTN